MNGKKKRMGAQVHVRIDNRLLHGQVVQFWIPHLGIDTLIVADDEVAESAAMQAIYRMALPNIVGLRMVRVEELASPLEANQGTALLLVRDIPTAKRILNNGTKLPRWTLGNVHASPDRTRITDAVYLSAGEIEILKWMHRSGVAIEIQTFPGETLPFSLNNQGEPRWGK